MRQGSLFQRFESQHGGDRRDDGQSELLSKRKRRRRRQTYVLEFRGDCGRAAENGDSSTRLID
jgi:hypothetical protein